MSTAGTWDKCSRSEPGSPCSATKPVCAQWTLQIASAQSNQDIQTRTWHLALARACLQSQQPHWGCWDCILHT